MPVGDLRCKNPVRSILLLEFRSTSWLWNAKQTLTDAISFRKLHGWHSTAPYDLPSTIRVIWGSSGTPTPHSYTSTILPCFLWKSRPKPMVFTTEYFSVSCKCYLHLMGSNGGACNPNKYSGQEHANFRFTQSNSIHNALQTWLIHANLTQKKHIEKKNGEENSTNRPFRTIFGPLLCTSAAGTAGRFTTPVTRILARWGSAMARILGPPLKAPPRCCLESTWQETCWTCWKAKNLRIFHNKH